jgi:hypothetical protein
VPLIWTSTPILLDWDITQLSWDQLRKFDATDAYKIVFIVEWTYLVQGSVSFIPDSVPTWTDVVWITAHQNVGSIYNTEQYITTWTGSNNIIINIVSNFWKWDTFWLEWYDNWSDVTYSVSAWVTIIKIS